MYNCQYKGRKAHEEADFSIKSSKKEAERLHCVVKITIMIFERGKEHEKYA